MKTDNIECLQILEPDDLMEIRRDIITLSRFISKVIALRSAQKDFFSEKSYRNLATAKALETEIDAKLPQATIITSKISNLLNSIINDGLNQQTNKDDFESSADCFRDSENSACEGKYEREGVLFQ